MDKLRHPGYPLNFFSINANSLSGTSPIPLELIIFTLVLLAMFAFLLGFLRKSNPGNWLKFEKENKKIPLHHREIYLAVKYRPIGNCKPIATAYLRKVSANRLHIVSDQFPLERNSYLEVYFDHLYSDPQSQAKGYLPCRIEGKKISRDGVHPCELILKILAPREDFFALARSMGNLTRSRSSH